MKKIAILALTLSGLISVGSVPARAYFDNCSVAWLNAVAACGGEKNCLNAADAKFYECLQEQNVPQT